MGSDLLPIFFVLDASAGGDADLGNAGLNAA